VAFSRFGCRQAASGILLLIESCCIFLKVRCFQTLNDKLHEQIVFGGFNGRRSLNDLWKLCPKSGPRGLGPEGWQAGWGSSDGAEWQLIQHDDGVQANKGLQGETKNIASQGTAGPVARHFRCEILV
jgi:hypothetical protein